MKGRGLGLVFGLIAVAALGALAFVNRPRTEIVVAMDQAFEAMRPGLVARFRAFDPLGNRLTYLSLPVDNAPSTLLHELEKRRLRPQAIVASPLVARALVEGAARNNAQPPAPVIALEWSAGSGQNSPGLPAPIGPIPSPTASILSDPVPAARRLGRALGSVIADLRRGSPRLGAPTASAVGAIIWESGPERPEAERRALEETWTAAAGDPPLELVLQPNDPNSDSQLRDLFSKDIRALFVDAGSYGPEALDQADGKITIIAAASGAARAASDAWPHAALALEPDEAAIVALIRSKRATGLRGDIAIASIVRILPGAAKLRDFDIAARLAAH
ncbi:MAG: hypothetical protein M0001_13335 [Treponema sp.]|nr:hypothetical protein [Treponema sp.]